MVIGLLLSTALGAEVRCDPAAAQALVREAGILPHRAPISHPELVPALVLASERATAPTIEAVTKLCRPGGYLSLVPAESWQAADWSAHTFLLSRTVQQGCTLVRDAAAISIGVHGEQQPTYHLRSLLPQTQTPTGDCPTEASWREERQLDGAQTPVHLVLVTDLMGGEIKRSAVIARRATESGWQEELLLDPAPPRLLGGSSGPSVTLSTRGPESWMVVSGFRRVENSICQPLGGQTVWVPSSDGWEPHRGRSALSLLAQRGDWRLAGDDAWFLIVEVMPEDEPEALRLAALDRMQERSAEPLYLFSSSSFPGLNPGFWIIAPAPWPTEGEARDALKRWRSWRRAYVKQGWTAPPACALSQQD